MTARDARVDLYWLPLGAGGRSVRGNGLVYEAVAARRDRRPRVALYHSALEVVVGADTYAIEMTPVWPRADVDRGVVVEGPVGTRWLGRSRLFRYEVRRWRGGEISDVALADTSPVRIGSDALRARRLLALVPSAPALTWGRDELRAGDMWNSNSLVAWLLAMSGHDVAGVAPPPPGRAPGWAAGLDLARRSGGDGQSEVVAPLPPATVFF
jgi:hypothetical protein